MIYLKIQNLSQSPLQQVGAIHRLLSNDSVYRERVSFIVEVHSEKHHSYQLCSPFVAEHKIERTHTLHWKLLRHPPALRFKKLGQHSKPWSLKFLRIQSKAQHKLNCHLWCFPHDISTLLWTWSFNVHSESSGRCRNFTKGDQCFLFLIKDYQCCRITTVSYFIETCKCLITNYHILNNNAGQLYQCTCNLNPSRRSGID